MFVVLIKIHNKKNDRHFIHVLMKADSFSDLSVYSYDALFCFLKFNEICSLKFLLNICSVAYLFCILFANVCAYNTEKMVLWKINVNHSGCLCYALLSDSFVFWEAILLCELRFLGKMFKLRQVLCPLHCLVESLEFAVGKSN